MIPGWINIWIARILSGEVLAEGSRKDTKLWTALFACFPIAISAFLTIGLKFLNHAGPIGIWIFSLGTISATLGLWLALYRFLNLKALMFLSALGWLAFYFAVNKIRWHPT